jgi:hypothetical protein
MSHFGLRDCAERIVAAVRYINTQLSHRDSAARIKKQFFGNGSISDGEFAEALAAPLYGFQTAGAADPVLGNFCAWMRPSKNFKALQRYYADRWAAWPLLSTVSEGSDNPSTRSWKHQ